MSNVNTCNSKEEVLHSFIRALNVTKYLIKVFFGMQGETEVS